MTPPPPEKNFIAKKVVLPKRGASSENFQACLQIKNDGPVFQCHRKDRIIGGTPLFENNRNKMRPYGHASVNRNFIQGSV